MADPDSSDPQPDTPDSAPTAAAQSRTPQDPKEQHPRETHPAAEAQSAEQGLIAQRRSKVEALREAGQDPFPNDTAAAERTFIGDLRNRFAPALGDPADGNDRYRPDAFDKLSDPEPVTVFGRLLARRGFGKLSFLKLRDATGEVQLFARRNVLGAPFDELSQLDVGDHVEAKGPVMLTKSGELSVDLKEFRLLGKALRPLPEKWHGLTDVEQRYRRRYVDLVANPQVAHTLRARAAITQGLRDYLDRQRFVEVETPTLHTLVGGAIARPFSTRHNALDLPLYLRIAPELYLKRLLVGGLERVYEIGRCYRNEGISTRHNPEFTMLELYQAYANYEALVDLGEAMLRHVDGFLSANFERFGLGQVAESWRAGRSFTLDEPFARVSMRDAIAEGLERARVEAPLLAELEAPDFDPVAFSEATGPLASLSPRAGRIDWRNLNRALGKAESAGERTFVAYEYVAEPFLAADYRSSDGLRSRPVFVTEHPTDVSPLAKRKREAPHLTERFELFVDSMEVGNAFSELNDPDDQADRFRAQVARKSRGQEETMDYDADYIRALEHGMPPAAGFGLGIDRLTMQFTGQESIRDVIAFPLLRPEASP